MVTQVGLDNNGVTLSEELLKQMEDLCDAVQEKTSNHIVLLVSTMRRNQKYRYNTIIYINRSRKTLSEKKGFMFLDLYWEFEGNITCPTMRCNSTERAPGHLEPVSALSPRCILEQKESQTNCQQQKLTPNIEKRRRRSCNITREQGGPQPQGGPPKPPQSPLPPPPTASAQAQTNNKLKVECTITATSVGWDHSAHPNRKLCYHWSE